MATWLRQISIHALVFGLLLGLISGFFSITDSGLRLEQQFGLSWLFKLRGPIPAPANVVIIGMDKPSAAQFGAGYALE